MSTRSDVTVDVVHPPLAAILPSSADILDAAEVFAMLADPGRLRLLTALRVGEASVGHLAAIAQMSESATSHALRLLRAHRIVQVRRAGRMAYYQLADTHVRVLLDTALEHAGHSATVRAEPAAGGR